jgi:uncharacterized SAM-binding protein YcdF (DUF218 family)
VDVLGEIAKLLIPGSVSLLLVGAATGAILCSMPGRRAKAGRALLILLVVVYVTLGTQVVSETLEASLAGEPLRIETAASIPAIVVLGNGTITYVVGDHQLHQLARPTAISVLEAVRLWERLGRPRIVVSGGTADPSVQRASEAAVMRDELAARGVPAERIEVEESSTNTYEQVVNVAALLRGDGVRRFVLVTSPVHMRRARAAFRRAGLDPVAAASRSALRPALGWFSVSALRGSEAACYEYVALIGYWLRNRV